MPTKRIDPKQDTPKVCKHWDHEPPMYQHFEPGTYEHTCSGCGHVTMFTVPNIELGISINRNRYHEAFKVEGVNLFGPNGDGTRGFLQSFPTEDKVNEAKSWANLGYDRAKNEA